MNGVEVAEQIWQSNPSSRIIFATQNKDGEVRRAALAAGAAGYLIKGEAERKLLPAIESALRDGH